MWAPNRHCFVVVAKRRQVTIVLAGRGTWVLVNQRFVFATQSEVLLCLSERLEMLVILAWSRRYLLLKLEISALSDYRSTTDLCC